jgi:putative membrane protein
MMSNGFTGMMGSGFGGWGGNGILGGLSMFFMGVIPLLVVGLIAWAIVEATRRRDPVVAHAAQAPTVAPSQAAMQTPPTTVASSARALLDERYARGEMGRDEYLERRGDLG